MPQQDDFRGRTARERRAREKQKGQVNEPDPLYDRFNTYMTTVLMGNGNVTIGFNMTHPTHSRIKRLLPDGRLDPTFSDQLRAEWIFELVPLSNGKLLVLHGKEEGLNSTEQHLVRLNEDGSVDSSFDGSGLEEKYFTGAEVLVSGGRKGFRYLFQTSSNLRDWTTRLSLGPIQFDPDESHLGWLDGDAWQFRQHFYRVVESPP
jgi:hypothetical protein